MPGKMWNRSVSRTALTLVVLATICTAAARAQSDDESNGAVQFNFSTPGARSLALGGAFLGSADDATAAYTNPAGLLQLSEPELSVEARRWNFSTPFASHGRLSGVATGVGADTAAGIELGVAEAELEGVSFAALVYPRPRWALALFYHQVANFEAEFQTGGIFDGEGLRLNRLRPVRSSYDLDISQVGIAFAREWDGVAAGIGVSLYSLELDSITQRFQTAGFFDPVDFGGDLPVNFQTQTGSTEEVGYTVGLRWSLDPKTSLGMVYRFGPEFEIDVLSSTHSPGVPIPPRRIGVEDTAVFNLPDVAGVGLSYRPRPTLTFNLDAVQVRYSDLVDEFFVFFERVDEQPVAPEDFQIDDVVEIRAGLEYIFSRSPIPLAVRIGGWFDPDHRLRAEDGPQLNRARLFAGDDQVHATAGLGLVISSRLQIDVAVDVSDTADTASISGVYRF